MNISHTPLWYECHYMLDRIHLNVDAFLGYDVGLVAIVGYKL